MCMHVCMYIYIYIYIYIHNTIVFVLCYILSSRAACLAAPPLASCVDATITAFVKHFESTAIIVLNIFVLTIPEPRFRTTYQTRAQDQELPTYRVSTEVTFGRGDLSVCPLRGLYRGPGIACF